MNYLIEQGYMRELVCGENYACVLNDKELFFSTEYKVLQSQKDSCFVQCMKTIYNGKIQLYYLTSKYKPLSTLLASLDADSFLRICTNLFADIIAVKNNGFLSCQSIDVSLDKIYVEKATQKVKLIYYPVTKKAHDSFEFENELKCNLIKVTQGLAYLSTEKTMQFTANLSDGTKSIEDIYDSIRNSSHTVSVVSNRRIALISTQEVAPLKFIISKDVFVIGRKEDTVDGFIPNNRSVTREHCKITRNGSQYSITDLKSSYGTYVNGKKLQPEVPLSIAIGDQVTLSNVKFQVVEA